MADSLKITCPCCSTVLTVDPEQGDILAEDRPKKDVSASFENALDRVRSGSKRREDAFSSAFDRTRRLDDVLEKKFEEARKRTEEDPADRPVNPLDLD